MIMKQDSNIRRGGELRQAVLIRTLGATVFIGQSVLPRECSRGVRVARGAFARRAARASTQFMTFSAGAAALTELQLRSPLTSRTSVYLRLVFAEQPAGEPSKANVALDRQAWRLLCPGCCLFCLRFRLGLADEGWRNMSSLFSFLPLACAQVYANEAACFDCCELRSSERRLCRRGTYAQAPGSERTKVPCHMVMHREKPFAAFARAS